jgi:hypothetical protein
VFFGHGVTPGNACGSGRVSGAQQARWIKLDGDVRDLDGKRPIAIMRWNVQR